MGSTARAKTTGSLVIYHIASRAATWAIAGPLTFKYGRAPKRKQETQKTNIKVKHIYKLQNFAYCSVSFSPADTRQDDQYRFTRLTFFLGLDLSLSDPYGRPT